jgi:hypothetical protein
MAAALYRTAVDMLIRVARHQQTDLESSRLTEMSNTIEILRVQSVLEHALEAQAHMPLSRAAWKTFLTQEEVSSTYYDLWLQVTTARDST